MKKIKFLIMLTLTTLIVFSSAFMLGTNKSSVNNTIQAGTLSDQDICDNEIALISRTMEARTVAIANFMLPTISVIDNTITWESSNSAVIDVSKMAITGGWVLVNRPTTEDVDVVLTVTISRGTATATHDYTVKVLKGVTKYNEYQITYDSNVEEFTNNENNPDKYYSTQFIELQAPSKEDHQFNGWYLDEEFTKPTTIVPMGSGNVTLYAKFTARTLTGLNVTVASDYQEHQFSAYDTYDKSKLTVKAVYAYGDPVELSASDYDLIYENAGTSFRANETKVTVSYTDSILNTTKTYDIPVSAVAKKVVDVEWTNSSSYTYTGLDQSSTVSAVITIAEEEKALIVTSNEVFKNAGTYTFTASIENITENQTILSNYTLNNNTLSLTIENANIDMSGVSLNNKTVTYNGSLQELLITGTLPEGVTVVYTNNEKTNAGTYEVQATFSLTTEVALNYNVPEAKTATLTIEKANIDMSGISLDFSSRPYNGLIQGIKISGTLPTYVSVSYSEGLKDVGSKDITATFSLTTEADLNYNVPEAKTAQLMITPILLKVTADNKVMNINMVVPTFTATITGFANDETADVLGGTLAYECAADGKTTGEYTITPKGLTSGNYNIYYVNGTLTVRECPITLETTSKTVTYNGQNQMISAADLSVKLIADSSNVTENCSFEFKQDNVPFTTAINAGTYNFKVYVTYDGETVDFNYTLTIEKASLTVGMESFTAYKGATATPVFVPTYNGFVNSETATVLSGSLEYNYTNDLTEIGTSEVTLSGLSSDNYEISYSIGTLNVVESILDVVVSPLEYTYQGQDATPLFHSITVKFNETTLEATTYAVSKVNNATNDPFTGYVDSDDKDVEVKYTISHPVYGVISKTASATFTARPITVTIDNKSSVYGEAIASLTASITTGSLVEGDEVPYTLSKAEGTTVNTYEITGTKVNDNYDITFVYGTYTITARPITVTIDDKSSVYGEAIVELTASITTGNLVGADTTPYTLSKTEGTSVNTYAITGTKVNNNYDITFVDDTYTITARPITVTIDDKSSVYGEAIVELTASITTGNLVGADTTPYTLSKAEGTSVNTYAITGTTANNNYNITFENGTYTINAKQTSELTFDEVSDQFYTGSAITPVVVVKDGTVELALGTDYTVAYSNNTEVTTEALITITLQGNYSGEKEINFNIVKTEAQKLAEDVTAFANKYDSILTDKSMALLPQLDVTLTNGSTVIWTSKNIGVSINASGSVSYFIETTTSIILTAEIRNGDSIETKVYNITLVRESTSIEDTTSNVTVVGNVQGLEVVVDEEPQEELQNIVVNDESTTLAAYNITLEDQTNTIVQPNGAVTVRLPIPEGSTAASLKVYYKNGDTYTDMGARIEEIEGVNYLVFITNHFSTYVVVEAIDPQILIVNRAYELQPDDALTGTQELTGVIITIDTPYSEQYSNITVTIVVAGLTEKPIQCFRLKGNDAANLGVGDTIKVSGTIKNYNGTIEFDANCEIKEFTAKVWTDAEKVAADKEALELTSPVIADFDLPATGAKGSTIAWAVKSGTAIAVEGGKAKVTVPSDADATVVLTATITCGDASDTKELTVVVNKVTNYNPDVAIYEVYGAGGNTGATYKNDYVVLINRTNTEVTLNGWSLQYASATGEFSNPGTANNTPLTGSIAANGYYVIILDGGSTGKAVPVFDCTGTTAMSKDNMKLALVNNTEKITNSSDENVIDYVGIGDEASEYLGTSYAPSPGITNSIKRKAYTGNNSEDYQAQSANLFYLGNQLATPTGLKVESNELSWTTVENATSYDVYNDTTLLTNVTTTTYDISLLEDGSYTFKVVAKSDGYFNSETATLSYTKGEVETWTLVTDVSELVAGKKIIIVASGYNKALGTTQNGNNRNYGDVTKSTDKKTITLGSNVQIITLAAGKTTNTFAFYVIGINKDDPTGYLYAASSSKNYLKTEEDLSDNSSWLIEFTDGVATIKAQGSNTRNWLRNNGDLFACYASGQNDVSIYIKTTGSSN